MTDNAETRLRPNKTIIHRPALKWVSSCEKAALAEQVWVCVCLIRILYIQGGNQLLTKSTAQLWPHFESWWLFDPTEGSPDVVHLIINASEVSGWLLKASVGLQTEDTFGRRYTILGHFCILWFLSNDLNSGIWHCVPFKGFQAILLNIK